MKNVHFATRKHLSRRAFIRGAGALVTLPWLEAMVPAFATPAQAAVATAPPRRFLAMNYPFGFHGPHLFPKKAGKGYELTPYLESLKDHCDDFSIISGLSHEEQNGANGHTSELTWLTASKHPGLPGFRNSISLDQFFVEKLAPDTRYRSLILNVNGPESMSWTANGVNIPAESSPSKLFQLLFVSGSPDQVQAQLRDLKRGRSILDTVNGEAKKLQRQLGRRDQEKFDQYLTSVRELETRLLSSEAWAKKEKPHVSAKPPTDITDRNDIVASTRLMHDLMGARAADRFDPIHHLQSRQPELTAENRRRRIRMARTHPSRPGRTQDRRAAAHRARRVRRDQSAARTSQGREGR